MLYNLSNYQLSNITKLLVFLTYLIIPNNFSVSLLHLIELVVKFTMHILRYFSCYNKDLVFKPFYQLQKVLLYIIPIV